MKNLMIFLFSGTLLIYNCSKDNEFVSGNYPVIELKTDFSEHEFKNAILGKWQSQFEYEGEANIQILEFNDQEKAKIKISKNNKSDEYTGDYSIAFPQAPTEETTTSCEVTIAAKNKTIELKDVKFDLHNGVHFNEGLLLRIDESPFGVLKRVE